MDAIYTHTVRTAPAHALGNTDAKVLIPLACTLRFLSGIARTNVFLRRGTAQTAGKYLPLAKAGRTASLQVSVQRYHSAQKKTGLRTL